MEATATDFGDGFGAFRKAVDPARRNALGREGAPFGVGMNSWGPPGPPGVGISVGLPTGMPTSMNPVTEMFACAACWPEGDIGTGAAGRMKPSRVPCPYRVGKDPLVDISLLDECNGA